MLDLANSVSHQIQTKNPWTRSIRGLSRARNTHLKSLSRMANGVWRETARRHSKAHYLLAAIFSDGFEIFKSQKDFCEIPASPGLRLTGDTNTNAHNQTSVMEREQKRFMKLIHVTYSGWIFLTCCSLSPCVSLLRNILMSLTFIIIEFSCNGRRRVCVCAECCFDERKLLWVSLARVLARGWIIKGVCF